MDGGSDRRANSLWPGRGARMQLLARLERLFYDQAIRTEVVAPPEVLTDRWLIEALSQLSSNPRVRSAAAAWLHARRAALELGFAEDQAQARADEALRREVEANVRIALP